MLAEPEIFWNDGLPFFARMKSGASAKDYGEEHCGQQCIMVQYPQFFTNVTRDDFLDNKNSAYYTIWQTLRDCAKTITSSGTNAIWFVFPLPPPLPPPPHSLTGTLVGRLRIRILLMPLPPVLRIQELHKNIFLVIFLFISHAL